MDDIDIHDGVVTYVDVRDAERWFGSPSLVIRPD